MIDYQEPRVTHGRMLAESCPKCGAAPGELCVTRRGEPTAFHIGREKLARYIPLERGEMPQEAQEFDNEMRGVLFPQEAKTEKHPNLTGNVQVNGVKYRLAAWSRKSQAGKKYLSLSVSEIQEKADGAATDDDLPF